MSGSSRHSTVRFAATVRSRFLGRIFGRNYRGQCLTKMEPFGPIRVSSLMRNSTMKASSITEETIAGSAVRRVI